MRSNASSCTSFPDRLLAHATNPRTKDNVFVSVWSSIHGIERLTFSEFAAAVASGATIFQNKHGIQQGDRVALLAKGTLNFFVAVLSLQSIGATPVLLNWRQSVDTMIGMCLNAGVCSLLYTAQYSKMASQLNVSKSIELDTEWIWSVDKANEISATRMLFLSRKAKNDEALIFFTSGSTSEPKPVLHTNASLLWSADNFPLIPGTRNTLCFMPNFHVLQTFQNFLIPLVRGFGCSIHGDDATVSISPRLLLSACAALEPTTIDTVPFIMTEWSTMSEDELLPLRGCAAVRSGGAPLPIAVAARLKSAGINVQTHYGQTEAPGMQLLTVPSAAPNELAIMLPPWDPKVGIQVGLMKDDCIETIEEGELVIFGSKGSSPGYLKDGKLIPNSSKEDRYGRHRTGDIFRWIKTRSGARGLCHVSRVDDTILLSTGEMFNPVPIEKMIEEEAAAADLCARRMVVLGQNRTSPVLVIELSPKEALSRIEFTEELWSVIESKINPHIVEYARMKKDFILIVDPRAGEETIPHSLKGNVIRKHAEDFFAEKISGLIEDVLRKNTVDWSILAREAREKGFGDDVDTYLQSTEGAHSLNILGVDSLGIASLTTSASREADRINDNIKAWMITTVVMVHWYGPSNLLGDKVVGVLDSFYQAPKINFAAFHSVSYIVQVLIWISSFISGFFQWKGFTPSMSALAFAIGQSDSARDGSKGRCASPLFGKREQTIIILILYYKCFIFPINAIGFQTAMTPGRLHIEPPINDCWFLYAMLSYRIAVFFTEKLFGTSPRNCNWLFLSIGALLLLILGNEWSMTQSEIILPYKQNNDYSYIHKAWIFFVSFFFDSTGAFVLKSSSKVLTKHAHMKIIGNYYWVFYHTDLPGKTKMLLLENALGFLPMYATGYYHGSAVVNRICRRYLVPLGTLVLTCLAYLVNLLAFLIIVNWSFRGEPWAIWNIKNTSSTNKNVIFGDPPAWLWIKSDSSLNTVAGWRPVAARPFYVLFDFFQSSLTALIIIAACTAAPFRASRCGNAALGKFLCAQLNPNVLYLWFLYVVSYLGTIMDSSNPFTRLLQLIVLAGYPYFFLYFVGPFLTAFVLLFPRLFFFLCRFPINPLASLLEAREKIIQTPSNLRSWWKEYCYEVNRDLAALRSTIRAWRTFLVCSRSSNTAGVAPLLRRDDVPTTEYGTVKIDIDV